MNPTIEAFVQAVEVWVPDGEIMRHHSGAYGPHVEFARVSARKTFQRGEGLPGRIWEVGKAEVWSELGPLFVRAELARATGIEAALGVPIFHGDRLAAVLVLLCGRRSRTAGCIEIWDPDHSRSWLGHAAAHYGTLTRFGDLSRLVRFGSGCCLAGRVWQRGEPEIVRDLADSYAFTRSSLARESGLEVGLGIPIFRHREVVQALLLLSAQATPLARSFEIWVPSGGELRLATALHVRARDRAASTDSALRSVGILSRVTASLMPIVFDQPVAELAEDQYSKPYAEFGVAIPIHDGESLRAVVVLNA